MVCVPVAMAASTAVCATSSLAGGQCYWRSHFNRSKGHNFRRLTRASSYRLHLFPVAAKRRGRQEATSASEESSYSLLTAVTSRYNEIVVLETPETRILLLDSSHNIHSILHKEQKWTGSYWDEFASLPAIIPKGPIAILGLGAGTAAHLILDLWPSFHIEGWEIDGILIDIAREYFALSDLESCSKSGGSLSIHIGDALSPSATVEGGFAGIIVDLFSNGKILPQLREIQQVTTWLEMEKKLMPDGRIMINCGGAHTEIADSGYIKVSGNHSSKGCWAQNSTIKAMCKAFPGKVQQLSWRRMEGKASENYLALTGPAPDLDAWSAVLPHPLDTNVKHWRPCALNI
ncbi:hypothetical protein KSP39_PZI022905 [Platanthera zijinensis]|uniref:Uncharacterized protein n=1 Tax=Platanthera zijinensis TaxID=2320716 RepID=A0AAP0AW00_9ASPA